MRVMRAICLMMAMMPAAAASSTVAAAAAYPTAVDPAAEPCCDPPASQPARSAASVDRWAAGLCAADWRLRRRAMDELIQLGDDAGPRIQDLLQRDLDREGLKNLQVVRRQIEDNRILGPSLITLHLKDATPRQVVAELSRQCAGALPTEPEDLWWKEADAPRLTLDYDRRPFWEVVRDLAPRLCIDYLSTDPNEILIRRASTRAQQVTSTTGAFLFTANVISFRNRMNVELAVYGEPKIVILRSLDLKVQRATDAQGNGLIPQTGRFFGRRGWPGRRMRGGSRQIFTPFQRPPDGGTQIGRYQGELTVVVQTRAGRWEITDPLSMSPDTRLIDSVPITIDGLTPSGDSYELQVGLPYGWSTGSTTDEVMELLRKHLSILDEAGHPLSLGVVDSRITNDGTEITASFARSTQPGGIKPGKPAKIVWLVPDETRRLTVPFDFKDIPVDDPFN